MFMDISRGYKYKRDKKSRRRSRSSPVSTNDNQSFTCDKTSPIRRHYHSYHYNLIYYLYFLDFGLSTDPFSNL